MSHKTRLLSFCLICFSLLLSACGGGSASSTSSTTLSMWTWKEAHVAGLQAIAADFKAQTGITVNINAYQPDDTYRTKITTAAQTGNLPDIVSYWSGSQWDLAASGILSNITGQVDASWQSQFLPNTYTKTSVYPQQTYTTCQKDPKCTYKNVKVGQVYSVPYVAGQAYFIYANKSILQKAGLNVNTIPSNAEQWLSMMETVKSKTGTPGVVTGAMSTGPLDMWLYRPLLMTSCGVSTYDAIFDGKDSFANPCSMRVFNWIDQLAQNKLWMPGILQTDINPADQAFSQGKAAFDIGGTYTLSYLLQQGMKASDIMTFPVPALQGSVYPQLQVGVEALIDAGITASSPHQQEAMQFLKFMTQPTEMEKFAKTAGDLPAVKISTDPSKVGNVLPGLLKGLSNNSPFNQSQSQAKTDPQNVLELGLQQFITGEITPGALARKLDAANAAAWKAAGGPA
jgi:ABC-type glycerol-3-phosphate transport system substrate-binding protein